MAVKPHSLAEKIWSWRAASACRASSVGQGKSRLERSRTASCPARIGSRRSSPQRGNPNIAEELKAGKQLGSQSYKVHLDGYNQLELITGNGPSRRREIFYFAEGTLGAVRIGDYKYRFIDQPGGWLGGTVKPDWPFLTNLRLDPFERTGMGQSMAYFNWMGFEIWRFVLVQQVVASAAESFIDFPPMQKSASFNLEGVKEQIIQAMKSHHGH
jgi:arylsulfatase